MFSRANPKVRYGQTDRQTDRQADRQRDRKFKLLKASRDCLLSIGTFFKFVRPIVQEKNAHKLIHVGIEGTLPFYRQNANALSHGPSS